MASSFPSSSSSNSGEDQPEFDPLQFIDLNLNCKICRKSFTRKDAADRHARTHLDIKPPTIKSFHCPQDQCDKSYQRKRDLDTHLINVHNKRENPATNGSKTSSESSNSEPMSKKRKMSKNNNTDQEANENESNISSSDDEDDDDDDDDDSPDSNSSEDFGSNDDLGLSDDDDDVKPEKDEDDEVDNDDDDVDDPSVQKEVQVLKEQDLLKVFPCLTCGQKFRFEKTLHEHEKIHGPPPDLPCTFCNKVFRSEQGLGRHVATVHEGYNDAPSGGKGSEWLCTICGKNIKDAGRFRKHMALHSGHRPYLCSHCASGFVTRHDLKRHEKIHTDGKPFKCTFEGCDKRYRENRRLIEHMRVHTSDKPFQCPTCNRSFTNSTILYFHRRTHTGEKRYHCEICPDKSYTRSSDLNRHIRTHTGEKPNVCHCGKAYSKKQDLLRHQKLHTDGVLRHKCPYCPGDFTTLKYRQRHILKFHQDKQDPDVGYSEVNYNPDPNNMVYAEVDPLEPNTLNESGTTENDFVLLMR